MTYTHLATEELVMIETYFHQKISVMKIGIYIGRSRQTIHNVVTFLRKGYTTLDYFKQYKENKKRCG